MFLFKRPIVWLWVLLTAVSFWFYPRYELSFSVEMHKSDQQVPSLYYSFNTRAFTADKHLFFSGGVALEQGYRRYSVALKTNRPLKMLRLDPLNEPGDFKIRKVEFLSARQLSLSMPELMAQMAPLQQLEPPLLANSDTELVLRSQGDDPFFTLKLDPSVYGVDHRQNAVLAFFFLALIWALVIGLCLAFQRWYRSEPWLLAQVRTRLRQIGGVLSDHGLIVFTPRVVLVVLSLALIFALGVGLKLNLSALGAWDNYLKLENHPPSIALGHAKLIRTDEWYVHSPWVLNQANRGLPVDNSNIGPPGAALLVAVPVKHISMIAQPKYWGFLFLDVDRAFAWFWMAKALGLLLIGFLLFLALTRNDFVLSIAGAFGLYSSSYLQWWFSAFTPEVLTGFMASLLAAIYLLKGTRLRSVWAGAVLLPLSLANLVLHLYPAHLVPMAYLAVFLLVPLVWMAWSRGVVQPLLKIRLLAGGLAMLAFAALAYSVISTAWPAIQSMMGTVYPGRRFSLGGGLSYDQFLMGYFEFWRDGYEFPNNGGNQSESARFMFLFPVGLAAIGFYKHDKRLAALIAAGTLYAVFCLFWMSLYLPEGVRQALAHLGWSYVPRNRLFLGLGVVSIFVAVLTCQLISKAGPPSRLRMVLAWTVAPALLTWAWFYLRDFDAAFYSVQRLLVSVFIVGGLVAAVMLGKRWWFLGLFLLSGWFSLQVNPVLSGTGMLLDKTVFISGAQLAGDGDRKWVVFGDLKVAQGLRAKGQDVLNGVQYAPNHEIMSRLDPSGKFSSAWNRYANMGFTVSPEPVVVSFKLLNADLYIAKIHPCHVALDQLGVELFAFSNVGNPGDFPCLRLARSFPVLDVYFYERVR
jgi:hypothetical protein